MTLGDRIKSMRKDLNMTQIILAKKAGLANTTLCDIEKNRLTPSIKALNRIVSALNTTLPEFFMGINSVDNESVQMSTGIEGF